MISTITGKRRKLTRKLEDAHDSEFQKKILNGEYEEVGIKDEFITEVGGDIVYRHSSVQVMVTTQVEGTILRHKGSAFVYWAVEELSPTIIMRHQGARQFCYRATKWDELDLEAINYAKNNFTMHPLEMWDDAINGWKGKL